MANVRTSIAALITAAAIGGGIYEGTNSSPPADKVGVNEVVTLRAINSKTFDKGNGEKLAIIGATPMNWDNVGKLETIDTTIRRRPFLVALFSKYEFESYIGSAKALFDSVNATDYAFAVGDVSVDYTFLSASVGVDVKTEVNSTGVKQTYTVSDNKITELKWLVEGSKRTLRDGILTFTNNRDESVFYTEAPVAWDFNHNFVYIKVTLDGDTLSYLIEGSPTYPVEIDPTTSMYTASATPTTGFYKFNSSTYLTDRNGTDYESVHGGIVGQSFSTPNYLVARNHYYFDSSGLPDNATITGTTFSMGLCTIKDVYANYNLNTVNATTTGTDPASGWFNDYDGWSTSVPMTITELANTAPNTATFAVNDTIKVTLNATGLTKISLTAATRFMVISSLDVAGTQPNTNNHVYITADLGYLQVTYTTPSGFAGKIDTIASITKIDGISNAVKVDGIQ